MTAELGDQEKPADNSTDEKSQEAEKIQIEKGFKNGSRDDLKVVEEENEDTPTAEKQEAEDDVPVVAPQKKMSLFARLFKPSGKHQNSNKQDAEAGTELLSKDGKIEITDENNKHEKNGSGTDITIAVTNEYDFGGKEAESSSNNKDGGKAQTRCTHWKRISIGLSIIIIALIIISVISILTSSSGRQKGPMGAPIVVTDCGSLRGTIEDNVYVFRSVPYALPPIDDRRWKPPMAPSDLDDCWKGTYDANRTSPICFQRAIPGLEMEMSEDCLYLDIITPSLSPPEPRPVVVYIPGDHPLQGYTSTDLQWRPSTALAEDKDVTFVTINYRTGVFGFLTLDILSKSVHPPSSGNYGIMDMLTALRWVQGNIRGFGGDPKKVTVLANGGAATAGLVLLSTKKAEDLFSRMWLTGPSANFSNKTLEQVGQDNSIFLRKLDCETLDCLYNKSSEEILTATPSFWESDWSIDLPSIEDEKSPVMAVIDGHVLYDTPFNMWNAGDINQVSVVIGSTAQESGSSTKLHDLDSWNWTDFSDYVAEKLESIDPNLTAAALQFYINNSSSPRHQFHTMVSDIRTICPLENLTEALDVSLQEDVFWYIMDYTPSSAIQLTNESAIVKMSVHGLDIIAVFGLLDQYVKPMQNEDVKFQKNIQELFYSFVHHGKPTIKKDIMMASNFINMISDHIQSLMTPYKNCHIWSDAEMYLKYAKEN